MSRTEFRRLSADRLDDHQRIVEYGFDAESGPRQGTPEASPGRLGQQYGVFSDEQLCSVCTHHDFTVSLRSDWMPLAGLADLTTLPEYRREGHVSRLVDGSLRSWRGEYPLAALWPFDYGYYEQFGWAVGCKLAAYTLEPAALASAEGTDGTLRRVTPDDWRRLREVHRAHALGRELTVRRSERWWRERIFRTVDGTNRVVDALDRDGTLRGYVAYSVDPTSDGDRMTVLYSAFTDENAWRGLFGLLGDRDSQVAEIRLFRGTEMDLLDRLADPGLVDCEIHPGAMIRVVDVVDALERLSYPDGSEGTLLLCVSDGTAGWNDGLFELTVANGKGQCRRLGGGEPDVSLGIGALSQLLVGYHSVGEARRLTDLRVGDEEAAARLAAWFPPRRVQPLDNF